MKIWIINNTNMLPEHGHLNRHYYLGKHIKLIGHEPLVFVGSHPHNTNLQLINGNEKYRVYQKLPFPWILIKTRNYEGSKIARVISMFEFYRNMTNAANFFERPDVIIGSSTHPLAALLAIKLGKRYNCQKIVEIRDLWPESIVDYGLLKKNGLIAHLLYRFEKYLYTHADKIIFTMENAYQYIEEQGWSNQIPESKVFYLNNGVDLDEFNNNKSTYKYIDDDLNNKELFKVVYTGAIRKVNNVGQILDVAKLIKNKKIVFLIWGDGYELDSLKQRVIDEKIKNVVFKGVVEKKYIPSITSSANLNLMHGQQTRVLKYGLSANKLFDYAAAGKPILIDFIAGKNPAEKYNTGLIVKEPTTEKIVEAIEYMASMPTDEYEKYCNNAKSMAADYCYANLAQKVINIINT